jgi:hypothetical protein
MCGIGVNHPQLNGGKLSPGDFTLLLFNVDLRFGVIRNQNSVKSGDIVLDEGQFAAVRRPENAAEVSIVRSCAVADVVRTVPGQLDVDSAKMLSSEV